MLDLGVLEHLSFWHLTFPKVHNIIRTTQCLSKLRAHDSHHSLAKISMYIVLLVLLTALRIQLSTFCKYCKAGKVINSSVRLNFGAKKLCRTTPWCTKFLKLAQPKWLLDVFGFHMVQVPRTYTDDIWWPSSWNAAVNPELWRKPSPQTCAFCTVHRVWSPACRKVVIFRGRWDLKPSKTCLFHPNLSTRWFFCKPNEEKPRDFGVTTSRDPKTSIEDKV